MHEQFRDGLRATVIGRKIDMLTFFYSHKEIIRTPQHRNLRPTRWHLLARTPAAAGPIRLRIGPRLAVPPRRPLAWAADRRRAEVGLLQRQHRDILGIEQHASMFPSTQVATAVHFVSPSLALSLYLWFSLLLAFSFSDTRSRSFVSAAFLHTRPPSLFLSHYHSQHPSMCLTKLSLAFVHRYMRRFSLVLPSLCHSFWLHTQSMRLPTSSLEVKVGGVPRRGQLGSACVCPRVCVCVCVCVCVRVCASVDVS